MHSKHGQQRKRTYQRIDQELGDEAGDDISPSSVRRMFLDCLFDHLGPDPVSWCGFYRVREDTDQLFLAENVPAPACSPIGRHGVCGRGLREGETVIVEDVRELGDNYVECDPDDRAEIVVPLRSGSEGEWWGVFDADSHRVAAFDEVDARWLPRLMNRHLPGLFPQDVEEMTS